MYPSGVRGGDIRRRRVRDDHIPVLAEFDPPSLRLSTELRSILGAGMAEVGRGSSRKELRSGDSNHQRGLIRSRSVEREGKTKKKPIKVSKQAFDKVLGKF